MRPCLLAWLLGWLFVSPGAAAPPALQPPARPPLFQELNGAETGVVFEHRLVDDHPLAYLYHSGYACGGVCIGDVDGDRRPDIFVASGPDQNALFLNKGGMRFEKSAAAAVEVKDGWAAGAAMADVDGDGDLDIYVCHYNSPNHLYLNDGQGRFAENAEVAGLGFIGPSISPYFADLDGNGSLDLFLLANRMYSPTGYPKERAWSRSLFDGTPRMKEEYAPFFRLVQPPWGRTGADPFIQEYGHADRIFLNIGPGPDGVPRFRDVTEGSGIELAEGHGLSAVIFDANDDGRPDIYVANDYIDPDILWINQGVDAEGRLRFQDQAADRLPYTTWFSMGSDIADVNNDGRLDFFVGDMAPTTHFKAKTSMGEMAGMRLWVLKNAWPRQAMRNCLFINTGTDRWQEAAFLGGVARSDWTWSVKFGDYDLDGRADLFLTNGIARTFSDSDLTVTNEMRTGRTEWEIYKALPEMRERNLAFRNGGRLQFQNSSALWGLDKESMSYGAASGDLDGDGDVDLVVCNLTENVSLYRNDAADRHAGHWLTIRLEPEKNRTALGAIVTVKSSTGVQSRLHNPMTGFLSSNEPLVHFGLGEASVADEIRVRWPSGKESVLTKQRADRVVEIVESSKAAFPTPPKSSPAPWFSENSAALGLQWAHQEKGYDDYQREFLLPGKLSQFGPGLAVGDVNGDQIDDLFLCGAAGQAGKLFVGNADGKFTATAAGPWQANARSESVAALLFDADRDGDLDLYVVSGSNEWPADDPLYADHLYLNDTAARGPITFREAPAGALPPLHYSGSCIVANDFDQDGDLDLFVGSRSVPGAYPVTPASALLRNDSSGPGECRFSDWTENVAGLKNVGLVTAALWNDVDNDGWSDLLVVSEWGAPRLFRNDRGNLREATDAAGLKPLTGWWNSATAGDFDGDGDLDFAVLNAGLNTKYGSPNAEKPLFLYRGDMDRNGRFDLVEAKPSHDGELPIRGRSCSSQAMPFIKEKFKTYKAFAASSLDEIYSPATLGGSLKVSAATLASGVLDNQSTPGSPRFAFRELPPEAQLSPGYGAVAGDFNGDGWCDLVSVENHYTREPETGLWRGGVGSFLAGGKDGFVPVNPAESGWIVPGDGKGLGTVDTGGRPTLVALQNNDRLLAFTGNRKRPNRMISVRLAGPAGNPTGVGARVQLLDDARIVATHEISAGSGYQSQSTATIFLTVPATVKKPRLAVRWPGGKESSAAIARADILQLKAP